MEIREDQPQCVLGVGNRQAWLAPSVARDGNREWRRGGYSSPTSIVAKEAMAEERAENKAERLFASCREWSRGNSPGVGLSCATGEVAVYLYHHCYY